MKICFHKFSQAHFIRSFVNLSHLNNIFLKRCEKIIIFLSDVLKHRFCYSSVTDTKTTESSAVISVTNMYSNIVKETIFNLIQQIKDFSTFLSIIIKFPLNYITRKVHSKFIESSNSYIESSKLILSFILN